MKLLERYSCEFRMRHIEADGPGELLNQDTFCWGTLKGVGKVYTSKMPITSADLLNDRVVPFYDALAKPVNAILTDNGREFCGRPDNHPNELFLQLHDIEHRTTRVRSPRTNGFIERMNRTLLDECFRINGRTTWYIPPDEIQRDLDKFLVFYNLVKKPSGLPTQGPHTRPGLARCHWP